MDALKKIKIFGKHQFLTKDYYKDLVSVIESDGLSGFDLRAINKLTKEEAEKLPKAINQNYLNRIINTIHRVDEGEEILILSEEFQ